MKALLSLCSLLCPGTCHGISFNEILCLYMGCPLKSRDPKTKDLVNPHPPGIEQAGIQMFRFKMYLSPEKTCFPLHSLTPTREIRRQTPLATENSKMTGKSFCFTHSQVFLQIHSPKSQFSLICRKIEKD